ncbi:MAG TPA: hypothetical protein PK165_06045 [bacterium]|nr:hypothetical protein [bacterium]HPO52373.1 hypothetical protein [bacterium]
MIKNKIKIRITDFVFPLSAKGLTCILKKSDDCFNGKFICFYFTLKEVI